MANVTNILHRFIETGHTLIFTSHMIANVEGLADTVVSVEDRNLALAN